jgi:hypothetical protein
MERDSESRQRFLQSYWDLARIRPTQIGSHTLMSNSAIPIRTSRMVRFSHAYL